MYTSLWLQNKLPLFDFFLSFMINLSPPSFYSLQVLSPEIFNGGAVACLGFYIGGPVVLLCLWVD